MPEPPTAVPAVVRRAVTCISTSLLVLMVLLVGVAPYSGLAVPGQVELAVASLPPGPRPLPCLAPGKVRQERERSEAS